MLVKIFASEVIIDIQKMLSYVDLTLLAQGSTRNKIKALPDDGMNHSCASCRIPALFVKQAKE